MIFQQGIPEKDGLYWFTNGLRIRKEDKLDYSILLFRDGVGTIFGCGGSCPLGLVYNAKICKEPQHSKIPIPTVWTLERPGKICWIQNSKGAMGIIADCNIGWLNHPQIEIESSVWLKENYENYSFSPVENPNEIYWK